MNDQCKCNDILLTSENYQCKTCGQLINNCGQCKYSFEPGHNLNYYVGPWNNTFSGKGDAYSDPEFNPIDSTHIMCTEAGPGLVKVM
jgi:hypothetical protein